MFAKLFVCLGFRAYGCRAFNTPTKLAIVTTIGAEKLTYTIFLWGGAPYYKYSIVGPQTLF